MIGAVRVFVKRERGEELNLVLKELFKEMFSEEAPLHKYLSQVEEMQKWAATYEDWNSFSRLLSDLECSGYCEGKQPPGLSVPLRPYQLQSLQFMLDAENREGGFLSIHYQRLPPLQTTGEELMYSATFGHLTEARQGISRGGFLCEEMGLGKTIEVFFLIHHEFRLLWVLFHFHNSDHAKPKFPWILWTSWLQILALILANPCPAERLNQAGCSKGTLGKL